jgi:hypothetical protein
MSEHNGFDEDDVTDEDYGFILGPDGMLKAMFLPAEVKTLPQSVKDILEMFEVEMNPENIPTPSSAGHTLH